LIAPLSASIVPTISAPVPALAAAAIPAAPAAQGPAAAAEPQKSAEAQAAQAAELFDGNAAPPAAPSDPGAPGLGSGLRMAREEHQGWLTAAIEVLSVSRTGRRVLRDIDALAVRRGSPVLLDVKPIGNNGEFRYDSNMLIMDQGHLKRDPYQSAPILAHELQHVLQRDLELPVDALELEIESYTVESRVWTELGIEPKKGTFARSARAKLKKGPAEFAKWLGGEYKDNIPLYGSTMGAYIEKLEKNFVKAVKADLKTHKKIRAIERVLESMKKNGQSDAAIAAHRREDLEPLQRALLDNAVNRGWIERDLRRLREPAIREAFRAYSRGVIRRARALSQE
jgi:hypothetical protein